MLPPILGNYVKGDPGLVWRGQYDSTKTYAVNDAVGFAGGSYVAIKASKGIDVSDRDYWDILAKAGVDGDGNGDGLVSSVNGQVGIVMLDADDVGAASLAQGLLATTAVQQVAGKTLTSNDYTTTEKTKLGTVQQGATLNDTDTNLKNRANHTGTQDISTVNNLQSSLTAKVDVVAGKTLSTNDYTTVEKTKLSTIATNATVNDTDANLKNRANHTGTQAIATVDGLQTAIDSKVNFIAGKGLSTNDYTTAEKTKLGTLDTASFRGSFVSLVALQTALPTARAGDYAFVDNAGTPALFYIWRTSDNTWQLGTSSSSPALTPAQVKTSYESNANTNAYTDSEKSKLTGIADSATANSPDATLLNRANHTGTQAVSTVSGLQTALDGKVSVVTGKALSTNDYTTADQTKLAGIATAATANSTDANLRDRTTHTGVQAISTVSGLQTALDTKQATVAGKGLSTNDYTTAEQSKLASVATGATANSTDALLRDRTTHTGSQAISTVSGLQSALDSKVTTVNGKAGPTVTLTASDVGAATTAQGTKADSAVQPATLTAAVATKASINDAATSSSTTTYSTDKIVSLIGAAGGYTDSQAAIAGLAALKRVDLSRFGDATTNAASALQNIATDGNVVYIPPGKTVLVNNALVTLSSSVPRLHIVNDGTLIYSNTSRMLLVDQPFGTPVTVSAISDVTYNSEAMTRITLSDMTGVAIGQIVKVYCDAKYPWVDPNGDSPFIAETVKISAVDTTANYIYVPALVWTSNIAAATTIRVATQAQYTFSLTGTGVISGDGDPDSVSYTTAQEAIRLQGVVDPFVQHKFKDAWAIGLRLESTYQGRVTVDFSGQKNDVTGTNKVYGYGIHYGRGCTGGVFNVQARDGRHPFTSDFDDSKSTFAASAIKDFGGPMYPEVTVAAIGTRGSAVDTHAFLGFATLVNCKVVGVRVAPTGTGTAGINNRGYGTKIFNADVRNCAIGINDDSYGQNTGKKFSTLIQGGSLVSTTYGVRAGGVQAISSVLTPELNHRLTIRDLHIAEASQGIQLDLVGASVNLINNQFEKITDVSVALLSDAVVYERHRTEDRSQFGAARDGSTGNGMYKITGGTGGATSLTKIQLFSSYVYGSTSRPTTYITGSATPTIGSLRVGSNKFADKAAAITSTSGATVTTFIDDDAITQAALAAKATINDSAVTTSTTETYSVNKIQSLLAATQGPIVTTDALLVNYPASANQYRTAIIVSGSTIKAVIISDGTNWLTQATTSVIYSNTTVTPASAYVRGINLSGMEYSESTIPGSAGTNYFLPTLANFQYWKSKGMNVIRLPILLARWFDTPGAALNATGKSQIDLVQSYADQTGMQIVLDGHDYAKRYVGGAQVQLGSASYTVAAWASDWAKVAAYIEGKTAFYGIDFVNEPNGLPIASSAFNYYPTARAYKQLMIDPTNRNPTVTNNWYTVAPYTNTSFGGTTGQGRLSWAATTAQFKDAIRHRINGSDGGDTLVAGSTYTISFYYESTATSGTHNIYFAAADYASNTSTAVALGNIALVATTARTRVSLTFTMPAGQTKFYYNFNMQGFVGTGYVEDFNITEGSTLQPFVTWSYDGSAVASITTVTNTAIAAVRNAGYTGWLLWEGENASGLMDFGTCYGWWPDAPWIDPLNKTQLSLHHYLDFSGAYTTAWTQDARDRMPMFVNAVGRWSDAKAVKVFVGEYGVPSDSSTSSANYRTDFDASLTLYDQYKWSGTYWAAGDGFSSITTVGPVNGVDNTAVLPIIVAHPPQGVTPPVVTPPVTPSNAVTSNSTATTYNGSAVTYN